MGVACCSAEAPSPRIINTEAVQVFRKKEPSKKEDRILVCGEYGVRKVTCDAENAVISLTRESRQEIALAQKWRSLLGIAARDRIPISNSDETWDEEANINAPSTSTRDRDKFISMGYSVGNCNKLKLAPIKRVSEIKVPEVITHSSSVSKTIAYDTLIWPPKVQPLGGKSGHQFGSDETIQLASKGIPCLLRREIWALALNIRHKTALNASEYHELLGTSPMPGSPVAIDQIADQETKPSLELEIVTNEVMKQIWLDVPRTFTEHPRLCGEHEQVQEARWQLFRVLKAFVRLPEQKESGYTQGMNFIAGVLWLHLGEEGAFHGLRKIFCMGLREFYVKDFTGLKFLQDKFVHEMKERFPLLNEHLNKACVDCGMYTTSWFLTCFLYNLELESAVIVWDVMLVSQRRIQDFLLAFSLAVMQFLQDRLLRSNFEQMNDVLIRIPMTLEDTREVCAKTNDVLKQF